MSSQTPSVQPKKQMNSLMLEDMSDEFYTKAEILVLAKEVIGKMIAFYPPQYGIAGPQDVSDDLLGAWVCVLSHSPRALNLEALRSYMEDGANTKPCSPINWSFYAQRAKGRLARKALEDDQSEDDWREISVSGRDAIDDMFWKCAIDLHGVEYFYTNCRHTPTRLRVIKQRKLED